MKGIEIFLPPRPFLPKDLTKLCIVTHLWQFQYHYFQFNQWWWCWWYLMFIKVMMVFMRGWWCRWWCILHMLKVVKLILEMAPLLCPVPSQNIIIINISTIIWGLWRKVKLSQSAVETRITCEIFICLLSRVFPVESGVRASLILLWAVLPLSVIVYLVLSWIPFYHTLICLILITILFIIPIVFILTFILVARFVWSQPDADCDHAGLWISQRVRNT